MDMLRDLPIAYRKECLEFKEGCASLFGKYNDKCMKDVSSRIGSDLCKTSLDYIPTTSAPLATGSPLATGASSGTTTAASNTGMLIACVAVGFVVIIVLNIGLCCWFKKGKRNGNGSKMGTSGSTASGITKRSKTTNIESGTSSGI